MLNKKMGIIYIGFLIIFDLLTKYLINIFLPVSSKLQIIPGFFALFNVHNTGAAFSILEGLTGLLTLVSLVVGIYLIYYFIKNDLNGLSYISLILMIAGTLGNFYDRLLLGYVRDFLSFNFFGYPFAVFNLADSFLVVGVIILGLDLFLKEYKNEKNSSK